MIRVLVVMGATASGKSGLAVALAEATGREIVSADSRQVYRGLRIGTAQPTHDEMARAHHHLVDFLPLTEQYSAQRFADDALRLIRARPETPPLVVGGTGFYLRSLWAGLFKLDVDPERLDAVRGELELLDTPELVTMLEQADPLLAEKLHPNDRQRIVRALSVERVTGTPLSEHQATERVKPDDIEWVRVFLQPERAVLRERIKERTKMMLAGGWLDEIRELLASGADPDSYGMATLGYAELIDHLQGRSSLSETEAAIVIRTCQYARRQEIWFRKESCELVLDPLAADAGDRLRELLNG
ncbi:MAG: tRNA (adenosine(37)-N6)-dimethylallyltransferase MiaA [bacterium]|nr:tRNA (adenosine(37)-N6)-dimethylallyltransferase MiaA [bacterium]